MIDLYSSYFEFNDFGIFVVWCFDIDGDVYGVYIWFFVGYYVINVFDMYMLLLVNLFFNDF